MYKGIFYTHLISVNLFLLIYLIKTILLLANKEEASAKFTKGVKVPEMIISTLFLLSGIYMLTQIPSINTLLVIKIILVLASIPLAVIGFKKKKKALAILSFVFIVLAYGLAEMSKKQGIQHGDTDLQAPPSVGAEPTSSTAAPGEPEIIDGKGVFAAYCKTCHGEDGKLGLMGSPDLTKSVLNIPSKVEIIRNGKGAMQPFSGLLTDEEMHAVARYVESLKN